MSINVRMILAASAVLAVFIIFTGFALERAFNKSAQQAMRERLLGQVHLLMAAAEVDKNGRLTMPASLPEPRFALPGSGLYGQISDGNGQVAWRSRSTLGASAPFPEPLAAGAQIFEERFDPARKPHFVYGFGVNWSVSGKPYSFTFSVAEDLAPFYQQIRRYRGSLWGWLGAMGALLLISQIVMLRWGLRPLRRVASELTAIEAGKQDRLTGSYPRELTGLTDNLNRLLRHERAQQARYRDALADLAHSLKTPLAVLRGALTGKQKNSSLAATVEEQVAHMDHIVGYQLQRAATAGASALIAPVPIRPIAEKVVVSLNKVHHARRVETRIDVDDKLCFRGDEGDLMELLGNLLDNAYKWCLGKVQITAAGDKRRLVITVADDGPGIEADKAESLLQRGARADENVPGHGIGLSIVQGIVQAYDGKITIGTSALGGAEIRLEMPVR